MIGGGGATVVAAFVSFTVDMWQLFKFSVGLVNGFATFGAAANRMIIGMSSSFELKIIGLHQLKLTGSELDGFECVNFIFEVSCWNGTRHLNRAIFVQWIAN